MGVTPTRTKKRLGSFLELLRRRADRTLYEAGEQVRLSDATISRYETGHVRPQWSSVKELLTFYEATASEETEALALWEAAGERVTRARLARDAAKELRAVVRAEREASNVRMICPLVIPGLLQLESYMRALNDAADEILGESPDEYVIARLRRQKVLEGPNPLNLHVVLDEAVIRRVIGSPATMCRQLGHLLSVRARENVTLQVIPFGAGAYGTMSGPCMIISYAEQQEPPGVYLEHFNGGQWVEDGNDVKRITTMFEAVAAAALSPGESADLIHEQMRTLETNDE